MEIHKNYAQMKKEHMNGWHTWNVYSVMSHVRMPEALALNICVKEYQDGMYLREALIGRFGKPPITEAIYPGAHTYDDSYTQLMLEWKDMQFNVETATDGDDILMWIEPLKMQPVTATIVLEAGYIWNRPGYVKHTEDGTLTAVSSCQTTIRALGGDDTDDVNNIPALSPFLTKRISEPVCFYTGRERTKQEIRALIDEKKRLHESEKQQYGEMAELFETTQCALMWDTIYDPSYDRVVSPVSRLWSINQGGSVLFDWDNYFAGYMASLGNKALAYANIIEMTLEITDDGFIPNGVWGSGWKSLDRSEPPVGSKMTMMIYEKYGDKWLLEYLYPYLMRWNEWYYRKRSNEAGEFTLGSDPYEPTFGLIWETAERGVNDTFGAAMEAGLDNSPMYDDIPFDKERHVMYLADVGLTGLFIMDCRALIEMAKVLGKDEDIEVLKVRRERAEMGLENLWDEEKGFYYNRRTDTGEFSRRISPNNFYALFSDRIPKERVERMINEHYYNTEEFYGDWMLPSIARNDPAFKDQRYWRGRVWAPMNFLVYLALEGHGLPQVEKDLAQKSRVLIEKEWNEHRHIHENYNSITGEGCGVRSSDKFYHWGALLSIIALLDAGKIK